MNRMKQTATLFIKQCKCFGLRLRIHTWQCTELQPTVSQDWTGVSPGAPVGSITSGSRAAGGINVTGASFSGCYFAPYRSSYCKINKCLLRLGLGLPSPVGVCGLLCVHLSSGCSPCGTRRGGTFWTLRNKSKDARSGWWESMRNLLTTRFTVMRILDVFLLDHGERFLTLSLLSPGRYTVQFAVLFGLWKRAAQSFTSACYNTVDSLENS